MVENAGCAPMSIVSVSASFNFSPGTKLVSIYLDFNRYFIWEGNKYLAARTVDQ